MKHTPYNTIIVTSSPIQAPQVFEVAPGQSLLEIVGNIDGLPERFWEEGIITVDGKRVGRKRWAKKKPNKTALIQLQLAPAGGGGKKGKNVLAIVASVLLLVATIAIGAGALTFLGPAFAAFEAGSFAAQAAAALVGLGGQLLINALFPPPVPSNVSTDDADFSRAGVDGNTLTKGGSIPRIAGWFKVAPPLLSQPWSYLVGDDEYAEGVFAFAGPHSITDVRAKGVPLGDLPLVEYFVDEGLPNVTRTNLFSRTGKVDAYNIIMSTTLVRGEDDSDEFFDNEVLNQADPTDSCPSWHRLRIRRGPDEAYIRLNFTSVFDSGTPDVTQIINFRLRIRKLGETNWKNLPQLVYKGKSQGTKRRQIVLKFYKLNEDVTQTTTKKNVFIGALNTVPKVTRRHFVASMDDAYQWQANAGSVRSRLTEEGAVLFLDDSYFNDDTAAYELEIKRSIMLERTDYRTSSDDKGTDSAIFSSTFEYDSSNYFVIDTFDAYQDITSINAGVPVYGTRWIQFEGETDNGDTVTIDTVTTVYNQEPIPASANLATIQIRAKNFDFSEMTALVGGRVPIWDGNDWSGLEPTSNPAAHLREIWANTLNLAVNTIEPEFIDNDNLVDWFDTCVTNDWQVNAILEGTESDAEKLICSCGYARPVVNTKYGVVYEQDTTLIPARQAFTPLNTRDMQWTVAYTEKPVGFRIEFYNAGNDYEKDEIIVYDPYSVEGNYTDLEALEYPGITDPYKARDRALFDFKQALKAIRYTWTTGLEHLASSQGDPVVLSHHMLNKHVDYFYVKKVMGVNKFKIDRACNYVTEDGFFDIPDLFDSDIEDIFTAGDPVGVITRSPRGEDEPIVITHAVSAYDPDDHTFTVEDSSMLRKGDMVIIGPLTTITKRVIILDIEPADQMTAKITAMDEEIQNDG